MTIFLPDLPGYIFRFARREDIPAIHQMLVCVVAADRTPFVDTLEDMHNQFIDPWSDPEKDYLLALTTNGQVAATGRVYVNPVPQRERNAFLGGEVHPEHRGRGLGEAILTWMEARGRQRLLEFPADLPRSLRTACLDYLADRIKLFEQHGFSPVRSWYRMRRDLSQPIPGEYLPPGLILRNYYPELDRTLRDAFNEAFSDHWGFEPITYDDWQQFIIHATSFRPELTFLALDGEGSGAQIASFSVNFIREEDNQRQGITEGIINELGTRRPWRKRGIASALVCESMRAFKAAGLDYASLGVDTENSTGALGLYERLGFKVIKRSITFSRPVEPDGDPRLEIASLHSQ
jgi:mycothiol synthase